MGARTWLALTLAACCLAQDIPGREWEARDLEGRWLLLEASLAEQPETLQAWCDFLASSREFALLEWLALYHEAYGPVQALYAARAPQWLRAAVWASYNVVGHSNWARQLLQSEPGVALPWLLEYDQLPALQTSLAANDPPHEPIDGLLPPLEEAQILAHLPPGDLVQVLVPGAASQPGVTYLHQLRRELRALQLGNLYHEPWLQRLVGLTEHRSPEVRALAWRAYTFAPLELIPQDRARAAAYDLRFSLAEREAAFLAFSYSPHPAVFAELHQTAGDPASPLWSAAVSRLADLGNGFSQAVLAPLAEDELDLPRRQLLLTARAQISARLAEPPEAAKFAEGLATLLARAAWVDLTCHPLENSLPQWTREQVRARLAEPSVRAELQRLAREFSSPLRAEHGSLEQRVRHYAEEWGK